MAGVRLAVLSLAMLACAGPTRMGGYPESEARVTEARVTGADLCDTRQGRIVVELGRVVIREYPHHHVESRAQQPLVMRTIEDGLGRTIDADREAWVAPARYQPGDEVDVFRGLVVFDRPMRLVEGRKQLVLRIAENDRSVAPAWAKGAGAATGAVGAVSIIGVPAPPAAVLKEAIELVRKVDRDDLVLMWSIELERLRADLARAPTKDARWPAVSYELETPRHTPRDAKYASASATVLAYLAPEPGCPLGNGAGSVGSAEAPVERDGLTHHAP